MGDLIERLGEILYGVATLPNGDCVLPVLGPGSYQAIEATADEAATALQSAEARNRVLVEALEPFAAQWNRDLAASGQSRLIIMRGRIVEADFRIASETLAKTRGNTDAG